MILPHCVQTILFQIVYHTKPALHRKISDIANTSFNVFPAEPIFSGRLDDGNVSPQKEALPVLGHAESESTGNFFRYPKCKCRSRTINR
ncbi:MAG: hypothetical protein LBH00_06265 [Planctomycetaceae bacterium]|jgi:hypothetical protein|nr:hypothetical protein [Planctomycetaceae bacterium]